VSTRLEIGRWWRLGRALAAWRRLRWRLHRPQPDAPEPSGNSDELREAARLCRKGQYEAALARLEELAPATRSSRKAGWIARDCHLGVGALHAALADIRRALVSGPSKILQRQARQLVGAIRETEPTWLPDAGPPLEDYQPADSHRVLHIVRESLPFVERGYTLRSRATFMAQKRARFDPVVVTSLGFPRQQGFDSFPLTEVVDGIEHHRLDLGPTYDLGEVPFDLQLSDQATLTRDLAERLRPAVIQAGSGHRGYDTALVGLAVATCLGVPFVYEVRSFLEHTWTAEIERSESGEHYHRRRQQELRCMLAADHVITITENMRDDIVARGVTAEKVSVVPNVVDEDRFTPREADLELQRKYGIEGRPVLGCISNIERREGIEYFVRAVAILRDRGSDVAGLVVGDGPASKALERLVGELGLTGHVVLTGHVEHQRIEDFYALIDVFVVPRVDDPATRLDVPLQALEAMAMQRPVVAADLPALRALVAPGERGEVFPAGDARALAAVAENLIAHPDQRARLARAGRSWVLREHTTAASERRYARALLAAAGGGQ
jgi:glycosyltransferase involved in cell wall biosynthesis